MVNKKINLFLVFSLLLSMIKCPMAKNIYSDPDLSKTSKKFEIFTIDFKAIDAPDKTYWSLCNWRMDLTEFKKKYPDATGGGAYSGLKTNVNLKTGILSFWEVKYTENGEEKSHRASRMYPKGSENNFGGEGEGTNYIEEFDWPTNVWHRFVIRSWNDEQGYTYVGNWIQNLETKEWTLYSYFNTNLINSYITGGLSQFQENYNAQYNGVERSFQFKNMYTYDRTYKKWISLNSTQLSFDPPEWKFDTSGTHEIGYTNNYFFGSAGLPVDNQKEYDENYPAAIIGTIMQPKTPNFIEPTFKYLLATITSTKITIDWEITSNTCPCYEYEITIQQSNNSGYKTIHTHTTSRPEQKTYTYTSSFKGTYKIGVKANAISGTQVYKEITKTI
jgi:hypothetical protein